MFPLLASSLKNGSTIIIDNLDSAINPIAVMSLIGAFHNNEINTTNAQLIFNTHNPSYLNSHLLRRDEIKFCERDSEEDESYLYSLSDFEIKGRNRKKGMGFMTNYLDGMYGAINYIDLSDAFIDYLDRYN